MNKSIKRENHSDKIKVALDKTLLNLIAETKAKNSYLVIADKKGNVTKIPTSDL